MKAYVLIETTEDRGNEAVGVYFSKEDAYKIAEDGNERLGHSMWEGFDVDEVETIGPFKVYVVVHEVYYEQSDVVRIFTTEQRAQEFANERNADLSKHQRSGQHFDVYEMEVID